MYLVCISVLVGVACLHHSAIHFEPAALAEAALPCPCHSLTFGHLQGEKKRESLGIRGHGVRPRLLRLETSGKTYMVMSEHETSTKIAILIGINDDQTCLKMIKHQNLDAPYFQTDPHTKGSQSGKRLFFTASFRLF